MFALHAGFRDQRLLVWLESSDGFDAGRAKLSEVFTDTGLRVARDCFETVPIWFPSARKTPVPSSSLIGEIPEAAKVRIARWTVTVAVLEASQALVFLCFCANKELVRPGTIIGADLAYWTAAMRFAGAERKNKRPCGAAPAGAPPSAPRRRPRLARGDCRASSAAR